MTGEGTQSRAQTTTRTSPPIVDGEVLLLAGVLGLTYLIPVVVMRTCLRALHAVRRRLVVERRVLVPAVIELKGRG